MLTDLIPFLVPDPFQRLLLNRALSKAARHEIDILKYVIATEKFTMTEIINTRENVWIAVDAGYESTGEKDDAWTTWISIQGHSRSALTWWSTCTDSHYYDTGFSLYHHPIPDNYSGKYFLLTDVDIDTAVAMLVSRGADHSAARRLLRPDNVNVVHDCIRVIVSACSYNAIQEMCETRSWSKLASETLANMR